MSGLSLEMCTSNLKFAALTVLKLLAFNTKKFRGSRDPGHAPLRKILKGSCPDCSAITGNMHVKFEVVRSFNRFSDGPVRAARAHRHRQTHIERKQNLRHSLRSLGEDNNLWAGVCWFTGERRQSWRLDQLDKVPELCSLQSQCQSLSSSSSLLLFLLLLLYYSVN